MQKRTIILLFILAAILFLLFNNKTCNNSGQIYQYKQGLIFNTVYNITYSHKDSIDFQTKIEEALGAVNNSLSMFNPKSTISKVNNNDTAVFIDNLFIKVFDRSKTISKWTNGAFDITVAPLVNLWGFGTDKRKNAIDTSMVYETLKLIGYDKITIAEGKVIKDNPLIQLDASAIAKGFACDVVADTLKKYGCENVCVEIGGEITAYGYNARGKTWHIGINKPIEDSLSLKSEIQEIAMLQDGGMATSGNYRNFYINEYGDRVSHTINPRTGFTEEHTLLSATIIAKDCITADALATACMVMGLEKSIATIEKLDSIHAFFIFSDKEEIKTWKTNNFPNK